MKKLSLLLAFLSAFLFAQTNYDWYNDPNAPVYEISSAEQLRALAVLVNQSTPVSFSGRTIKLTSDIVLSGNWIPIANDETRPFQGIFDGQGYTVSELSVSGGNYAGLFGYVDIGGQIKNLNVVAGVIRTTAIMGTNYAGGLVAYYNSTQPIENCSVQAGSIIAARSTGNATSQHSVYAGGLVGWANAELEISNSYVKAAVSADITALNASGNFHYSASGGLVGRANAELTIRSSYASGDISATAANNTSSNTYNSYSGGLVGFVSTVIISNSYTNGNVSSSAKNNSISGGLAGSGTATISNSYASGNVLASATNESGRSGGLVGSGTATISNSYASGNISASTARSNSSNDIYNSRSGGLIGDALNTTSIRNSYASGNVSATAANDNSYSGGLVGYANGTTSISNSYASGTIGTADTKIVGGIFGRYVNGTNISVYYRAESANQPAGEGSAAGITAIVDVNMKKKAFFANWDFKGIWGIEEDVSYPYLKTYIPLRDVEAEYIHDQTYTGTQITPEPAIRLNETTILTKDIDYKLSYGENTNAGNGTITITGLGDYSTLLENITFNIIPKTITITYAEAQNKTYDGTTAATITGTLDGVVAGNSVFIGTGTFANKDAANGIQVSDVKLTGTHANNYVLTQPLGLTANITRKALAVTLEPKSIKINISDNLPNFQDMLIYNGFEGSDTKAVITGTTYFNHSYTKDTSPAGIYPITLSGLLTATNYSISYDNTSLFLEVIGSSTASSSSSAITPSSSSVTPSSSSIALSSSSAITPSSSSVMPSSSSVALSSSSTITSSSSSVTPSSSSVALSSSSSSIITPSSSSAGNTPILLPQIATSNHVAQTKNGINLSATTDATIAVYNLNGTLVSKQNYASGVYNVSFGHLPKGMYIVKTTFGTNAQTLRVVVR